jgi:nitroreductase
MTPLSNKQKSAAFESPVLEVIQQRRSRRAFAERPVEQDRINSLFEAARWAPSSVNEQPWIYLYATKDQTDLYNEIFESLNESNKIWAKHAPLLIVSLIRKTFSRNEMPNLSARYDLGAANALLSLQAAHYGLNVHQMGGFSTDIVKRNLKVPDQYEVVVVMAVGYPGDVQLLPEHLKVRELAPRERYLRGEFVMNKAFDASEN